MRKRRGLIANGSHHDLAKEFPVQKSIYEKRMAMEALVSIVSRVGVECLTAKTRSN